MTDILAPPNNQVHECEESVRRRSVRFAADTSEQLSDDSISVIGTQALTPSVIVTGRRPIKSNEKTTSLKPKSDAETSATSLTKSDFVKPLVHRYVSFESKLAIEVINQWECIVKALHNDGKTIEVDLYDLCDDQRPVENGEFSMQEIPPSERPHIKCGTVLYWCVGYENRNGTHRRVSEIRRKRMPRLTRQRERIINQRATDLADEFGINTDRSTEPQ